MAVMKRLAGIVCFLVLAAGPAGARAFAAAAADRLLGQWNSADGDARIEISTATAGYCGRIVWMREPFKDGKPRVDDKNPDPALRQRPIQDLTILRGFVFDGNDMWKDGKIYDPKSGNEYRARITWVNEKKIVLRGYIGVPWLGRSEAWTR